VTLMSGLGGVTLMSGMGLGLTEARGVVEGRGGPGSTRRPVETFGSVCGLFLYLYVSLPPPFHLERA